MVRIETIITIYLGIEANQCPEDLAIAVVNADQRDPNHPFGGIGVKPIYTGSNTDYELIGVGVVLDNIQNFGEICPIKLWWKSREVRRKFIRWLRSYGIKATPKTYVTSNVWEYED